jgi:hypothetical protein
MLELVTTAEAKAHLRIDSSADDTWLAVFIPAISQAVLTWLKDESRLYYPERDANGDIVYDSNGDPVPELDTDEEPVVNTLVKAAVLLELGNVYRYREGEGKDNVVPQEAGHGYILNKTSTALLTGIRRPTVA